MSKISKIFLIRKNRERTAYELLIIVYKVEYLTYIIWCFLYIESDLSFQH